MTQCNASENENVINRRNVKKWNEERKKIAVEERQTHQKRK
jgi:hypothetical protein